MALPEDQGSEDCPAAHAARQVRQIIKSQLSSLYLPVTQIMPQDKHLYTIPPAHSVRRRKANMDRARVIPFHQPIHQPNSLPRPTRHPGLLGIFLSAMVLHTGCAIIPVPGPAKVTLGSAAKYGTASESRAGGAPELVAGDEAFRLGFVIQPSQISPDRRYDLGFSYQLYGFGEFVQHGLGLEATYYLLTPPKAWTEDLEPEEKKWTGRGFRIGILGAAHALLNKFSERPKVGFSGHLGAIVEYRPGYARGRWHRESGDNLKRSSAWIGDVSIGLEASAGINHIDGEQCSLLTLSLVVRWPGVYMYVGPGPNSH